MNHDLYYVCTLCILCIHFMCNKMCILLYVVAPKPSGSEAYCLTSHQGVYSEGLQRGHRLQVPHQTSSRTQQQGGLIIEVTISMIV